MKTLRLYCPALLKKTFGQHCLEHNLALITQIIKNTNCVAYFVVLFFQEECCGWNNYTDWYQSKFTGGKHFVPDSCCKEEKEGCGKESPKGIYTDVGFDFSCLLDIGVFCVLVRGTFMIMNNTITSTAIALLLFPEVCMSGNFLFA